MFKEWREKPSKALPTIEELKILFKGANWKHDFHMRSAASDVSTFRCDDFGLTKHQVTEHLDPDNPTGMYHLGKTTTYFTLDDEPKEFKSLAEVGAVLMSRNTQLENNVEN